MGWVMLYLFVFLKLPILAACWIVWWAVHQDGDSSEDGAGRDGGRPYRHPRPPRPRPHRRGPHGDPALASPPRIRSVTRAARARELEHHI